MSGRHNDTRKELFKSILGIKKKSLAIGNGIGSLLHRGGKIVNNHAEREDIE